MNEKQELIKLIEEAEEAVNFLSNEKKWKSECWICKGFLVTLGINVKDTDLIEPEEEPPDVIFQDANFEIFIVLDPNRLLHGEWKEELQRRKDVKSFADLSEKYHSPIVISPDETIDLLLPTLLKKKTKYENRSIDLSKIDVLVYVNLDKYHPDLLSLFPDLSALENHGWRSLSILSNLHSKVLFARDTSPDFLIRNIGKAIQRKTN